MTTTTQTAGMQTTGTREIQFREAINECLRQEMELDDNVIIIGEEIAGGAGRQDQGVEDAWGGPFRTTVGLIQQFGKERVLDAPLSEAAFIGTAIGAASTGLRTFVGEFHSLLHEGFGFHINLVQFLSRDIALGQDRFPEQLQGITGAPVVFLFLGAVGQGVVEDSMPVVAE